MRRYSPSAGYNPDDDRCHYACYLTEDEQPLSLCGIILRDVYRMPPRGKLCEDCQRIDQEESHESLD